MRHANNFDLIRLGAALLVLIGHAYALRGLAYDPLQAWTGLGSGGWGVFTFFAISGYLVARSWEADPHPLRYAARRALRIYPGLIVVTLLAAFVLGPLMTALPLSEYFSHKGVYAYLTTMTGFKIGHVLPGVFDGNWYPGRVNGSLWTLPRELKLYLIAPLAWIGAQRLGRWSLLAAWAALFAVDQGIWPEYRPLLAFSTYFMLGMAIAALPPAALPTITGVGVLALLGCLVFRGVDARYFTAVAIPCLAIGLGSRPALVPALGRIGDLSYGAYIYAFPVQQIIMALWPQLPLWATLLAPIPPVLLLAWLSWRWVERPALALKPRKPDAEAAAGAGWSSAPAPAWAEPRGAPAALADPVSAPSSSRSA